MVGGSPATIRHYLPASTLFVWEACQENAVCSHTITKGNTWSSHEQDTTTTTHFGIDEAKIELFNNKYSLLPVK